MRTRAELDKLQDAALASWATPAAHSGDRLHAESAHPYRTEYQRDRDRILHSRAFRRLQAKTQVFPYHQGDHVRNRLTHTLEVAQIARTIARALGANEDLTEAVVLAHDLGHPPFGHTGEHVLHELLEAHGGFEHNRQSLRIVDWVEVRDERYRGLNLTRVTRASLLKHGAEFPRYDHPVPLPVLGRQPCAEAQIANLADSIAYHTHDIDDGLSSGLLDWRGLVELALWRRALARAGVAPTDGARLARRRASVALIDVLVSDLVKCSAARLRDSGAAGPEDVCNAAEALVAFSPAIEAEKEGVANYLHEHFYRHHQVVRMAVKAERILADLWHAYVAEPAQLPEHVRKTAPGEAPERALADYVAGMTDRYAMDEHARLYSPHTRI